MNKTLAREIGLEEKAFDACLTSEEAVAKVEKSEEEARRLRLTSTPSIFVNGKKLEKDLARAVEKVLAE